MNPSRRSLVLLAVALGLIAALIEGATHQLIRPWIVSGPSMEPTFAPGDRVLVDLWTYRQRRPEPGEVLLFRGPPPDNRLLIKRCSRVPVAEARRPRPGYWPDDPGDEAGLWVLGDNPAESWDSRRFGAIPLSRVVGRVVLRYWPPSDTGGVPSPDARTARPRR